MENPIVDAHALFAPMQPLAGVSLSEPREDDREAIRAAADSDDTWALFSYRADGDHFGGFWQNFMGQHRPPLEVRWVVRHNGVVVGSTSFLNVEPRHKRLEIGGTWYRADSRATVVNPAAKFRLMERAFACGFRRLEFKTDARNARSRAAIAKLGGRLEGTLRQHMINHDGSQRDTVYYSILAEDWPTVRARLTLRIVTPA
ncbi:MAG: GNAT family protein [Pseudomonadota bacterium]